MRLEKMWKNALQKCENVKKMWKNVENVGKKGNHMVLYIS